MHDENIHDREVKERVTQYRIQHEIKQDSLPEGLKQSRAPPVRARISTTNMAHELVRIPEDMDSPPDSAVHDDVELSANPADSFPADYSDGDDINTEEIDSAQYDYPWSTYVNSTAGMQHMSYNAVTCPFEYRALQEWLISTTIQFTVDHHSTIMLHNDGVLTVSSLMMLRYFDHTKL